MIEWHTPVKTLTATFFGSTGFVYGMWQAGFEGGGIVRSDGARDFDEADTREAIDKKFWPGAGLDLRTFKGGTIPDIFVAVPRTVEEVEALHRLPELTKFSAAVLIVAQGRTIDGTSEALLKLRSDKSVCISSKTFVWAGGTKYVVQLAMRAGSWTTPSDVLTRVKLPAHELTLKDNTVVVCDMLGEYELSFDNAEAALGLPAGSTALMGDKRRDFIKRLIPPALGKAVGAALKREGT